MADNRDHSIWYSDGRDPVLDGMRSALNWARNNAIDPTVIDTRLVPDTTGYTDVLVYQNRFNGSSICGFDWDELLGYTSCNSLTTSGKCETHSVYYNTDTLGYRSDGSKREMACHELGHSLGLKHPNANDPNYDTTCMNNGYIIITDYNQHDRNMLYNWF